MPILTREPAIAFLNQVRSARLAALADAEAFDGIIHAVERLGSYLSKERSGDQGKPGSLFNYAEELKGLGRTRRRQRRPSTMRGALSHPLRRYTIW